MKAPKDKANLLHIITRFDKGGSAENTFLTVCGLDRDRYNVLLVTGSSNSRAHSEDPETAATEANIATLQANGVRMIGLPELVRELRPFSDITACFRLIRIIRRENPCIVHTHTSKAGILGRWAAWLCRVPFIVHTPHGHVFWGYFGPLETKLYVTLERITARITDRIIALTEQEKEDHLRFRIAPRDKFVTIHSGLDLSLFDATLHDRSQIRAELDIPPADLVVGTAGRLTPVKGHMHLIEAASKILAIRPDTTFVFLGDGELKKKLLERAEALGVTGKVRFPGWRPDVAAVMSAFDVFALPSLNEGMGRVLVEAMALSRGVVASRTGGIKDLVEDGGNGLLVPPGDAGALADAILRLLGDGAMRVAMGGEGRCRAEIYSAERMVQKIEDLYAMSTGASRA